MDAREAFAAQLERDEDRIDLARAALLFAAVEYPELDVDGYLGRLDQMAAELRPRLGQLETPELVVAAIDEYLFEEQGFAGNEREYGDPRNSYLNEVIDRGLGIPISLSVIYLEVARRIGIRLEGVNMPGHFLLRYPDPVRPLLIDAFDKGAIVTEEQCQNRLERLYGGAVTLTPAMLRPVGPRAILFRMLNNLKNIYVRGEDYLRATQTVDLMIVVEPAAVGEYLARGLLRFQTADVQGARADLERYLEARPDAPEAQQLREQLALIDRLHERRN